MLNIDGSAYGPLVLGRTKMETLMYLKMTVHAPKGTLRKPATYHEDILTILPWYRSNTYYCYLHLFVESTTVYSRPEVGLIHALYYIYIHIHIHMYMPSIRQQLGRR